MPDGNHFVDERQKVDICESIWQGNVLFKSIYMLIQFLNCLAIMEMFFFLILLHLIICFLVIHVFLLHPTVLSEIILSVFKDNEDSRPPTVFVT